MRIQKYLKTLLGSKHVVDITTHGRELPQQVMHLSWFLFTNNNQQWHLIGLKRIAMKEN